MKLKKILLYLGGLILVLIIALAIYIYPFYKSFFTSEIIPVDKNLSMITGAGNSGLLVTDSAVVVIDTKMGSMAKKLYDLAKEKAGTKKIIVINTHFHGDHVKGNHLFKGSVIYIGGYDTAFARKNMDKEDMPSVFVADSLILNLGDETVALYNLGQAHTADDMVVYLRNRKLIFSGDLVFNKINPVLKEGANVQKWEALLDRIPKRWDIKTVVPGHGKTGGPELFASLRQYFLDMEVAAATKGKVRELRAKYADWMTMPMMASPKKTIAFLRGK